MHGNEILYVSTFVEKIKRIVRGFFNAATTPISLIDEEESIIKMIFSSFFLGSGLVERDAFVKIVEKMIRELISEKRLSGSFESETKTSIFSLFFPKKPKI